MLVRLIEGILQQAHVRSLHGAEHGLHVPLAQAHHRSRAPPRRRGRPVTTTRGPLVGSVIGGGGCVVGAGRRDPRQRGAIDPSAPRVHDHDELDARVGLVAVGGEALVDGVQEAVVARQRATTTSRGTAPSSSPSADGRVLGAQVEDVQGRGEEQGELEGRADGLEGVCGRVVGGEDGDVEGVVLGEDSSVSLTACSFEERGVSFCRAYIPAYDA